MFSTSPSNYPLHQNPNENEEKQESQKASNWSSNGEIDSSSSLSLCSVFTFYSIERRSKLLVRLSSQKLGVVTFPKELLSIVSRPGNGMTITRQIYLGSKTIRYNTYNNQCYQGCESFNNTISLVNIPCLRKIACLLEVWGLFFFDSVERKLAFEDIYLSLFFISFVPVFMKCCYRCKTNV